MKDSRWFEMKNIISFFLGGIPWLSGIVADGRVVFGKHIPSGKHTKKLWKDHHAIHGKIHDLFHDFPQFFCMFTRGYPIMMFPQCQEGNPRRSHHLRALTAESSSDHPRSQIARDMTKWKYNIVQPCTTLSIYIYICGGECLGLFACGSQKLFLK